ncbi:hypothetical protein [Paracoccus litorisediminis]|uniref:hypothetical protein n=1 Tax=Paracoccus litorisediminis TaxID=2006130 RepID=UPI003735192A
MRPFLEGRIDDALEILAVQGGLSGHQHETGGNGLEILGLGGAQEEHWLVARAFMNEDRCAAFTTLLAEEAVGGVAHDLLTIAVQADRQHRRGVRQNRPAGLLRQERRCPIGKVQRPFRTGQLGKRQLDDFPAERRHDVGDTHLTILGREEAAHAHRVLQSDKTIGFSLFAKILPGGGVVQLEDEASDIVRSDQALDLQARLVKSHPGFKGVRVIRHDSPSSSCLA